MDDLLRSLGVSFGFATIFFGPLAIGAVAVTVLACSKLRRAWVGVAVALSLAWVLATAFAGFYISMGHAFSDHGQLRPPVAITIWFLAGLALIWLPPSLLRLAASAR